MTASSVLASSVLGFLDFIYGVVLRGCHGTNGSASSTELHFTLHNELVYSYISDRLTIKITCTSNSCLVTLPTTPKLQLSRDHYLGQNRNIHQRLCAVRLLESLFRCCWGHRVVVVVVGWFLLGAWVVVGLNLW